MDREEARVKLKSGTSLQWWLLLIDCSVTPLCDRDSETSKSNWLSSYTLEQCGGNSVVLIILLRRANILRYSHIFLNISLLYSLRN